MTTPSYNDIGKKIKDLFGKNFPAGFVKMSANFPAVDDVSINISGSQNIDSGKLASSLETKIKFDLSNKNFTLTEKWTTTNEIQSILDVNITNDLKSSIELNFEPSSGRKSLKLKNSYATEMINAAGEIECRQIEPILTFNSMFKLIRSTQFYGGGLVSFDTLKKKFTKIGYGVQYNNDTTCVAGTLTDHDDFLFQVYRKTTKAIELGIEAGYKNDSKKPRLGLAIKYDISNDSSVKAKAENNGNFSLGYTFLVRDGIKLTFGAKFDLKNFNGGGHKLGLQLDA